jgi:DNA repair protein RadC
MVPMIIGTITHAAEVLAPLFACPDRERVAVIHLDPERRLLALTLEQTGANDEVEFPIGRILQNALRIGSHGIVVAHNHPSGDPKPSARDQAATRALATAAAGVDIRLYDHIIFAAGTSSSFLSLGLL